MIRSVVIIAGYFILWALIHTALASIRVKKRAEQIFGPETRRYYRFFFVSFALVSLVPLVIFIFILPDVLLYAVPSPWRWLMNGIQVIVFGLMVWSVLQTEATDFLGIKQLRAGPESPASASALQTRGLYKIVRHPMYLTSIIIMWTTPVMRLNVLVLFAAMTLYFFIGSIHEEQLLIKAFGDRYRSYREQVGGIIPGTQYFRKRG